MLIPATIPFVALFKHDRTDAKGETRTAYSRMPVVAWDEGGYPYVPGKHSLVPANSYSNFEGIHQDDAPVVAAIPGGDWQVKWSNEDGSAYVEPVLAWIIDSDGGAKPISSDSDGIVDVVRTSNTVELICPGRPIPAEETS
ncbi:hypothetical protein Nocox_36940 [Nonomuraea coxensis DSM 45129]|uniref:Uncharacterized protein n=1 Tax=Nonomuraea coxensis DSM 45129 TaxID=1122611 RepID=A0ABX8UAY9_9ACTN|nr:hypothetical protein [Nonomuraea coxensis]QYC44942.1 hypothetical protein Nocox_36940 [Nonomuraea coxensis DSM 45129]